MENVTMPTPKERKARKCPSSWIKINPPKTSMIAMTESKCEKIEIMKSIGLYRVKG